MQSAQRRITMGAPQDESSSNEQPASNYVQRVAPGSPGWTADPVQPAFPTPITTIGVVLNPRPAVQNPPAGP